MDFNDKSSKSLHDLHVMRMLFLDHFFLFMGMNGQLNAEGTNLLDQNQYLFMMKGNQVKCEYKLHKSVVFLDKNIDNKFKSKFLLSLGYDE